MPKISISKQLIEMIANKDNSQIVKTINEKVNQYLALSIENLSNKVSYITLDNVVFQPINETFNNAFVDGSDYVYLLGVENAQLELNTIKKEGKWKAFKKRFIYLWKNRKTLKKKKKRRRKKKEDDKSLEIPKLQNVDQTSYTIFDLTEDLQNSLINYFSETTIVYIDKNMLQIVGKDDLGSNVKILIYVVNLEGQKYKYFINNKKGFVNIDITNRYSHLSEKQILIGDNFTKMIKIFNSLYLNVNGYIPNQVFIESVLCSCPEDLFMGNDIYKVFLKIVNYLSIKTIRFIKSINNPSKTIHEDKVCGNCGIGFNKMLEEIGKDKI